MRRKFRILQFFLTLLVVQYCYLASTTVEAAAATPYPVQKTPPPPPEGNTTFVDGTTWCVALPGVSQIDLQNALDWACGLGKADCKPIRQGGSCFEPDTLLSRASYAFNSYYQQNGNSDIACNFGGTATTTKHNPSYGKCVYLTSGSVSSSAAPIFSKQKQSKTWWKVMAIILLYFCTLEADDIFRWVKLAHEVEWLSLHAISRKGKKMN